MPRYVMDCEGKCCCRCAKCKGVGYYNAYDVTFPSSDGGWITNSFNTIRNFDPTMRTIGNVIMSGKTVKVNAYPYEPRLYGSQGGDGSCDFLSEGDGSRFYLGDGWYKETITGDPDFGSGSWYYAVGMANYQTVYFIVSPEIYSGAAYLEEDSRYSVFSINCRTGGEFNRTPCRFGTLIAPYDSCPIPVTEGGGTVAVAHSIGTNFATNITVAPSAGATWYQCGQNSDGSVHINSLSPSPMSALKTMGVRTPLATWSGKCKSLGGRLTYSSWCESGYGCQWKCNSDKKEVVDNQNPERIVIPRDDCGGECPGYVKDSAKIARIGPISVPIVPNPIPKKDA